MERLAGLSRPPFANYDIVVYFGGGLFLIPFAYRYLIEPLGLALPSIRVPMGEHFLTEAVATLTTLFLIYVVGHILAYLASQFMEKVADRTFGKVSSAIFVSCNATASTRNEMIRALIFDRLSKIKAENALIPTIVRFLFHIPAVPLYVLIFSFGFFGYYDTRVPKSTLDFASKKLSDLSEVGEPISIETKWYKPLEYYVINRCQDAVPRMYNYLVIAGLFRTLSMVFMLSLWAQIYYAAHLYCDGDWLLKPVMGTKGIVSPLLEYSLVLTAFTFSLFSFLKFQRRYAEEAIFAFAFEPPR